MRKKFVCKSKDCRSVGSCKTSVKVINDEDMMYFVWPDRCHCGDGVADWEEVEEQPKETNPHISKQCSTCRFFSHNAPHMCMRRISHDWDSGTECLGWVECNEYIEYMVKIRMNVNGTLHSVEYNMI